MIKICLNAGHGINTAGKRCLQSLDPKETREWTLNSRIVSKIEELLSVYEGYELLRVDDPTGKLDVPLGTRTTKANKFEANIYISIHHNAGVNGGGGGGIVAYTYTKVSKETEEWQKALYDSLIKHTGLKGNRSNPKPKSNLWECRKTEMPAVLLECGFMDSKTDVPIILTEEYAHKCAVAITEVIVSKFGLVKKPVENEPSEDPSEEPSVIYRVQVGAFRKKANAEALRDKLKAAGYDAIVTNG